MSRTGLKIRLVSAIAHDHGKLTYNGYDIT